MLVGWPKNLFAFFCDILWKNPKEFFGQLNSFYLVHFLRGKENNKALPLVATNGRHLRVMAIQDIRIWL